MSKQRTWEVGAYDVTVHDEGTLPPLVVIYDREEAGSVCIAYSDMAQIATIIQRTHADYQAWITSGDSSAARPSATRGQPSVCDARAGRPPLDATALRHTIIQSMVALGQYDPAEIEASGASTLLYDAAVLLKRALIRVQVEGRKAVTA